jgi:hypothetical protein
MKKFITSLLWFFLPLILVIIVISITLKKSVNDKVNCVVDEKTTTLVLGHSQTECGINDSLITGVKNFSSSAEPYFYTYQKLKKIVSVNQNIKTVLISFSNNQIDTLMNEWTYGDKYLQNFYPKYNFVMNSEDAGLLFKNNFTGFISSEHKSFMENLDIVLKSKYAILSDRKWGSYLYLKRNKIDSLNKTDTIKKMMAHHSENYSKINIQYLHKIVDLCKKNDIKLVLVRMPLYPTYFKTKNEILFQRIRKEYFSDVPFLDFHSVSFNDDEFGDYDHLNYKGAKRFSIFLDALIKEGLLDKNKPQQFIDEALVKSKFD